MTDETAEGTAAEPTLRTLADKMNRLIDRTRPADCAPVRQHRAGCPDRASHRGADVHVPDLLGVNELHTGLCRSLVQLASSGWSNEVDDGLHGCCTSLLYLQGPGPQRG